MIIANCKMVDDEMVDHIFSQLTISTIISSTISFFILSSIISHTIINHHQPSLISPIFSSSVSSTISSHQPSHFVRWWLESCFSFKGWSIHSNEVGDGRWDGETDIDEMVDCETRCWWWEELSHTFYVTFQTIILSLTIISFHHLIIYHLIFSYFLVMIISQIDLMKKKEFEIWVKWDGRWWDMKWWDDEMVDNEIIFTISSTISSLFFQVVVFYILGDGELRFW